MHLVARGECLPMNILFARFLAASTAAPDESSGDLANKFASSPRRSIRPENLRIYPSLFTQDPENFHSASHRNRESRRKTPITLPLPVSN